MNRLIQTAAVAFVLIAPAFAHAQSPASVTYRPAQLVTAEGMQAVKADIAKTADAYCRANPIEHTVAECRSAIISQLDRYVDQRAAQYAQAARATQLAQR